ncbi:metalloregulator ArsR/SmtB family transcription factor [Pseudogemmatithrix spongiicola]|uniref:Metalloregulator ArsR/SmtB family transcription factor n=1 Tax=Pseudogemmatithrix spongiicola TaxID=3062599 RepID=A0AA49JZ98_9BACT|nr:metalloregulator ArsR/SmtB family transcription factor [Gemmatimonadaceae bacterium 'strain 138']WKW14761.1 metalloregulator ArsR/SmtB family transcription factor [Gemmatimonadaceae bacterium 'strain 318']
MTAKRAAVRQATPELLERVAGRFRALAEPARLAVLHALEDGERTVSELVELTGLAQGNLSKHLQQLYAAGFVTRRRDGLFVQYALADDGVLQLCALMCDRLDEDVEAARAVLAGAKRR